MTKGEMAAASDILKYLQKRPDAKQTASGIAKYWIFQQRLEERLEIVLSAIAYLVKEGFLEEVRLQDTESYYRINTAKLEEIPRLLEKLNQENT
jgi:hypothetical protein